MRLNIPIRCYITYKLTYYPLLTVVILLCNLFSFFFSYVKVDWPLKTEKMPRTLTQNGFQNRTVLSFSFSSLLFRQIPFSCRSQRTHTHTQKKKKRAWFIGCRSLEVGLHGAMLRIGCDTEGRLLLSLFLSLSFSLFFSLFLLLFFCSTFFSVQLLAFSRLVSILIWQTWGVF